MPGANFDKIEHFFVLMLENRSFDHLFGTVSGPGLSPLNGSETCPPSVDFPVQQPVPVGQNAPDKVDPDPPHEFADVRQQLTGKRDGVYGVDPITMDGFAASGCEGHRQGESERKKRRMAAARGDGRHALDCQGPGSVGVLRKLADEYALCTNWFSSMPGPTWPNRFFVHAASSGGLDNSVSVPKRLFTLRDITFDFEHGTIFEKLGEDGWRVYRSGFFTQVLTMKGMAKFFVNPLDSHFRTVDKLEEDLEKPGFPRYVFIEPNHGFSSVDTHINSQHPTASIDAGERLIAKVYRAIRNSSLWRSSALIITYDEHGGFFDRATPPAAQHPGDDDRNQRKAEFPGGFKFDLYGVRVPTVIVSPWIGRRDPDATLYDHSSIPKTVLEAFLPGTSLTNRDRRANSFSDLFDLAEARDTPESAPLSVEEFLADEPPAPFVENQPEPEDEDPEESQAQDNLGGFATIAAVVDHEIKTQDSPPLIRTLRRAADTLTPGLMTVTLDRPVQTRAQAREYIDWVQNKLAVRLGELVRP